MVLDVRTPLRHSIIGLGLAMVMAVAGCSKEPTRAIREVRAQAPQTELTYAPLEFDTTNFRVHLYWNAYDNDGEVTRFHFAVDGDSSGPTARWKTTTANDTILVFSVAPVSVHTFKIAAEDNDGQIDPTPASRTFSARTVPPVSRIDQGPAAFNPIVGPNFTFAWSGSDPDGSPTGARA